jgi:hypothetical protein
MEPWQQALLWIGGLFAYVVCFGFTWALLPDDWSKEFGESPVRHFAALFWPITFAGYVVYSAWMIGPRTVAYWRQRSKFPRAEIRR